MQIIITYLSIFGMIYLFSFNGSEMKIVFADDHVMLREALRPFLLRLDPAATIYEAGSLGDVLNHLAVIDPALVILDLMMPGMEGCQGITEVLKRRPKTRCAVLSAVAERKAALAAIAAGAKGFISKQMSGTAMVSALQLILAGETFVPFQVFAPGTETGAPPPVADGFTPREHEVLTLLKDGLSNKGIANRLKVSEVTVKTHLGKAFRKLGVHTRTQALRLLFDEAEPPPSNG